jgi:hypothetical protein
MSAGMTREQALKVVILGLDPGIQNLLKTMDSRLRENDGQKQTAVNTKTLINQL